MKVTTYVLKEYRRKLSLYYEVYPFLQGALNSQTIQLFTGKIRISSSSSEFSSKIHA